MWDGRGLRGGDLSLWEKCAEIARSVWEWSYPVRGMCGICAECVGIDFSCAKSVRNMRGVLGKGPILCENCAGYVWSVWEWSYPVRKACGVCAGCVERCYPARGVCGICAECVGKDYPGRGVRGLCAECVGKV